MSDPSLSPDPPAESVVGTRSRPVSPRNLLFIYFGVLAVNGLCAGYFASQNRDVPRALDFGLIVATIVAVYAWYYADAAARNFRRTALLGGAVIMFTIVAVPYYLCRSRPPGQRLAALGRFVGVLVLSFLTLMVCSLPFLLAGGQS